jgi:hypothetical protein
LHEGLLSPAKEFNDSVHRDFRDTNFGVKRIRQK